MFIIDDSNAYRFADDNPVGMGRGRVARDWEKQPFGSVATPFSKGLLIPRSDWSAMIRERRERGQLLTRLCDARGVPVKNQGQTNYCWANAPVHCVEVLRAANGRQFVPLSAASVAARVKNFANVGGWGGEALQHLINHGANTENDWPRNEINRNLDTTASREDARQNRVTEWYELPNRSFDALMTCLLLGFPVAIGLNWWRHEVTAMDPVEIEPGHFGAEIDNSWDVNWGDKGRAVLSESKATPDDAVAPRVVTFIQ